MPLILAIENDNERNKATDIFTEYYSTMMYVALSIIKDHALAEDIVSDSMIKIINNLNKIDKISSYKTRRYIVVIVENTAKTFWKKQNSIPEDGDDLLDKLSDNNISILDNLSINESVETIVKAIRLLPKTLSDVLYLSAVNELSDLEISEALDISHAAVRMRLSRARKAIKKLLERE